MVSASAQPNVTFYGIVDVGPVYTNFKRAGAGTLLSLDSNGSQGSRFGFHGKEDLGDGLSAQFVLENGFAADTGTLSYNGRLFGRQSWVGLDSKAWGTLAMGRFGAFSAGTGSFDMWVTIDPFKASFGMSSINSTFSSGALRLDNSLVYRTPRVGGVQGGILYSLQSAQVPIQENAGSGNNNRTMGLGLNYANGPLYVVMTYDLINPATLTTGPLAGRTNPDEKHLQIGATYNFNAFKLHGGYAKQTNHSLYSPTAQELSFISTTAPLDRPDADSYIVGLTIPIGAGNLLASYQYRDGKPIRSSLTKTFEADRGILAVGYLYSLSKRTKIYVQAADSTGKKSIAEGTAATDTYNRREFRIGLNHNF